ncbi:MULTISPECIES: CD225/dispanin family protein [Hymenobacter]|uniref:CD225/dispanin family protein n=2 Tax=Hymenobacter TaxID=89966 RepID=A0ABS6X1F2_9BACT|nr:MULTISPECIES: CD225/dispanin family protein [Hymenobacter]MBO3270055.1 CD225/dispanin family protein [Hymenobacter defluvii]MBW3129654.1 CD225/dispanin family protein [Hymenobacter profundi]QNE40931.1 CD225/dispanin family protein [Hymenobacter sp. NBH84]
MENTYTSPTGFTPSGPPPKNWLVESILVTIFCCLPFGIAGIVNAANVNSRWAAGDRDGALHASQQAGKWTKIGFFVSIAGTVAYLAFVFLFGGLAMLNGLGSGN